MVKSCSVELLSPSSGSESNYTNTGDVFMMYGSWSEIFTKIQRNFHSSKTIIHYLGGLNVIAT